MERLNQIYGILELTPMVHTQHVAFRHHNAPANVDSKQIKLILHWILVESNLKRQ